MMAVFMCVGTFCKDKYVVFIFVVVVFVVDDGDVLYPSLLFCLCVSY